MAGSPTQKSAPKNLIAIVRKWGKKGWGKPAGLTIYKSNFVVPQFVVKKEFKRTGYKVEHYAVVQKTTATDAKHEAYYPGPGDHEWPGLKPAKIGGVKYKYFLHVSKGLAATIKKGEQEHLDDAARAFELSYGVFAKAVNSIAGKKFGPAGSPREAHLLAEAALQKKLPKSMAAKPLRFPNEYKRLLALSGSRDKKGWHSIENGKPEKLPAKGMVVAQLETKSTTKIGKVSSKALIK